MSDMPLLGHSRGRPRSQVARTLAVLVVLGAGGYGIYRYVRKDSSAKPTAASPPPIVAVPPPPVALPPPPAPPSFAEELQRQGLRYVHASVAGPLETAFTSELGRDVGEPLTQVVTRTLVWWINVPDDLRRGDVVDVVFAERQGAEPLVHAVRFVSERAGRWFAAYRYQAPGQAYAHYYSRDGQEIELRLRDAPLDDHEQVTSLLRDGRGHRGVDFRTPVGTPVKATFDGTVGRVNWSFRQNGNCLELKEQGGMRRTAFFLHLSEVAADLRPGSKITKGQVVAMSGNTGHSFAPHLHYQIMNPAGTVLDPFVTEGTVRRSLPDDAKPAFEKEVARLDDLMKRGADERTRPQPDAGP